MSFKESTRQRVREGGRYSRYSRGSELCEICECNVVGEHSSDPRCNETGLGVVLCSKCAETLGHVQDQNYVTVFEYSKTQGRVMIYVNYSHYVRTEDEANRLLEHLLKHKTLKRGWTSSDGTETRPWVVRGVKT